MFASRRRTVIAKGLRIEGRVTAEGVVEVNGRIDGELHGKTLVVSRGAHIKGTISADHVVVDGTIEGPINGRDVVLKSRAHVIGDIHHQSLSIENGATFEGRSVQTGSPKGEVTNAGEGTPPAGGKKSPKKLAPSAEAAGEGGQ